MSSVLFQVLNLLDKEKVHYRIERTRPETVQINAIFVGLRLEIEIFEDGHIETSRFSGNEEIESGDLATIKELIEQSI